MDDLLADQVFIYRMTFEAQVTIQLRMGSGESATLSISPWLLNPVVRSDLLGRHIGEMKKITEILIYDVEL